MPELQFAGASSWGRSVPGIPPSYSDDLEGQDGDAVNSEAGVLLGRTKQ